MAGETNLRDLALDDSTGDLKLVEYDLVMGSGVAALLQDVKSRLSLFRGEYFLDLSAGVPYFQRILVKNPNLPAVRAFLLGVVLGTPAIAEVSTFDLTFNAVARLLGVRFRATSDFGELVVGDISVAVP